jgi:hypothetical protein
MHTMPFCDSTLIFFIVWVLSLVQAGASVACAPAVGQRVGCDGDDRPGLSHQR